ncbi:MAG: DUF2225 domain-containing protein, partial [Oscillospiraceae bacterium]|nr:DUF2225 domain-containing protein [Oscillospiraceae bacterium]
EYICYEGQPGSEMYVILKGSVGVYVTNAIGTMTEVSRIMAGDFFGEMSIFDDLPRSASCIALEDTICVSISKSNLTKFFMNCPEMAGKLLENMSNRIRRLDNELYKTERFVQNLRAPKFRIPDIYSFSHVVEEPAHNLDYTQTESEKCPICGKEISVLNLRRNIMSVRKIDPDRRVRYAECDPLWFEVLSCPYCHYSNHHISFFRMIPFKREFIKRILKEQHNPVIEEKKFLSTPFDQLVLKYLQAIHINESVNAADNVLIGTLWLDLYCLATDSADDDLSMFFAKNAAEKLKKAMTAGEIADGEVKCSIALTLSHLLLLTGSVKDAAEFCEIAAGSEDSTVKKQAYAFREQIAKA